MATAKNDHCTLRVLKKWELYFERNQKLKLHVHAKFKKKLGRARAKRDFVAVVLYIYKCRPR